MKKYRMIIPTETEDCYALAEFLDLNGLRYSHLPMETYTGSWAVKTRNKRMGVRKGVPDYLIVIPGRRRDQSNSLLFIEMKRKGSSPSDVKPEQQNWIDSLNLVPNVSAVVCRGAEEAQDAVRQALNRRP